MKRTAVGLAAVAALGVAVAIPSVGQSQTSRTITLNAHTKSVKVVDLPPRGKSSSGDLIVSISTLRNVDGARVGKGYIACTLTGRARTFESANYECTGTNKLKDGSLTFAGNLRLAARELTVAVTGGTGAYDGATGTALVTDVDDSTTKIDVALRG
jgi:hypothetical protein